MKAGSLLSLNCTTGREHQPQPHNDWWYRVLIFRRRCYDRTLTGVGGYADEEIPLTTPVTLFALNHSLRARWLHQEYV